MKTMAAKLKGPEMADLAAYFAGLKPMTSTGDPVLAVKGKGRYGPCQGCHGPGGEGQGENPRLAGQIADYTILQLTAYKSGVRRHPLMNPIAAGLNDEEMRALAAYLASLP